MARAEVAGCERQVDLSRRRLSDATLAGPVAERMEAGDDESMTAGAHKSLVYSLERQRDERSTGTGYGVATCLYVVHAKPVCLKRGEFVRALMTHLRRCNLRLRHGPCARRACLRPTSIQQPPGSGVAGVVGVRVRGQTEVKTWACSVLTHARRGVFLVQAVYLAGEIYIMCIT